MKHKIYLPLVFVLNFSTAIVAQVSLSTQIDMLQSSTQLVTIEIEGMACQEGCADKISSNLKGTVGVAAVEVNFEKKEAIINFYPDIVSLADLKSVITNTRVKDYIYTIGKTNIKE
ncbi:heavy-metal-associated domain-containing protein [Maribacter sp. CXY002]|uniref:heavy-metal-associated domain-containing protein n=1 Tax=Maribacter luteocoastalis TaxID=3407671 RepID=UPI003B677C75